MKYGAGFRSSDKIINFYIKKYCTLDLSRFKKLDEYRVDGTYNNIVFIVDNKTHLKGVRYTNSNDIIRPIYKEINVVNDSILHVVDENDLDLLIDYKGNTILNLDDKRFIEHKNGYIIYFYNGRYGAMDIKGNDNLRAKYDNIEITQDGFIALNDNLMWGVIDFKGNTIIPFKYLKISYNDSFFTVKNKKEQYGVKDKHGKKVIKEKYNHIIVINNNMFYISNKKYNCIISKEKMVYKIPNENYPLVTGDIVMLRKNSSYIGYLLITDNDVIDLKCNTISKAINGVRYMMKGTKFYLTDKVGNIISCEYDFADIKDNTIFLKKNGEEFYVDSNNNIVKYEKKLWDDYKVLLKVNDDLVIANNDFNTMFIYDNNVFSTNELYTGGSVKGNFIILYKNSYSALYDKDGNCIIPLIEHNIYVVGDNKVVIDNHIIDLSCEYINFNFKYYLEIGNNNDKLLKTFDSIIDRDNYIKKIFSYRMQVNNELSKLNKQVKELNEKIERLKSIGLNDLDCKVLKLNNNTNKK